MKPVIDWVVGRYYRPVVLAVGCSPLPLVGPFITIALLVLVTALWGVNSGFTVALAASAVLGGLVLATGGDVLVLAGGGALSMAVGVAIGGLLRATRSLSLSFQFVLLFCLLMTAGISLFGPPPEVMFEPLIEQLIVLFGESAEPEQVEAVRGIAPMLLGVIAAGVFAQLIIALVIGCWWLGYAASGVEFGEWFRALRLGRLLGIFAMVWVTLGLFLPWAVVQNLTPLALMGFLFQGLAVMHAWAHGRQWHPGLIAPVYVLLVPPLTGITVMGLSAVGLLDNLFDLRKPLRA